MNQLISYAQNFEDVMLWRALGHISNGHYIDIGAHDPMIDSVSLAFYERGWRGIHVDAALSCVEKLRTARPDETVLHCAIDSQPGVIDFYSFQECDEELGISCADKEIAQRHIKEGYKSQSYKICSTTLDELFAAIPQEEVHWLKIDIEGFEARALEGWIKSPLRPWILVIESTLPKSTEETHQAWEPDLIHKGYKFAYFDGLNRFYVSNDHPEILKAFEYPPCVFDNFSLNGTASNTFTSFQNQSLMGKQVEATELNQALMDKQVEATELNQALMDKQVEATELNQALMDKQVEATELNQALMDKQVEATELNHQIALLTDRNSKLEAQNADIHHIFVQKQIGCEAEIKRLRALLYSAPANKHLYRALQVLIRNNHYRQFQGSTNGTLKTYKNLHVPWHTHMYRSLRSLYEKNSKPWHTHLYRATRSALGDSKYCPAAEKIINNAKENGQKILRPRILIDATFTNRADNLSGIQRVVRNVAREITTLKKESELLIVKIHDNKLYIADDFLVKIGALSTSTPQQIIPNSNDTIILIDSGWPIIPEYEVILTDFKNKGGRIVGVIYDIIPILMPHVVHSENVATFKRWLELLLNYCDSFVCISNAVAKELGTYLQTINTTDTLPIGYFHLGSEGKELGTLKTSNQSPALATISQSAENVFLMVGTLEPRKGYDYTLDAFEQLWANGEDVSLCIVGKYGWDSETTANRIHNHPNYEKKLFWQLGVTDDDLAGLYKHSDALIASSLAEGFGLPLIEAAHAGIPIICSDIPVFREVCQTHAKYFQCENPIALATSIKQWIEDRQAGKTTHSEGMQYLNWRESTEMLLDTINKQRTKYKTKTEK